VRQKILSVSELTAQMKLLLEERFPFVWVRGEVSNLRVPASGHCYFTLKDEKAQIAAVMFRGQNRQLKFAPEDGMAVVGLGRISVYEPRGSYQIILEYLEPAGAGALQVAFEQLKQRLAEAGCFDARHKQPIPFLPRKISVITSPSGAVVHDIITVIGRRYPGVNLEVVPVKVQGPGAEEEIASALELVAQREEAEVVILARGGGSIEDLQAFNSERVALAIFNCRIPVVSAVGHETDFTIADFVADLRAPTPSAAAELVVPEHAQLLRRQQGLKDALRRGIEQHIARRRKEVEALHHRLRDPRRTIQELWQRIDDFSGRLQRLAGSHMRRAGQRRDWLHGRLLANSPMLQVHSYNSKLEQIIYKIHKSNTMFLHNKQAQLSAATGRLEALNPEAILKRGYSITRTIPGRQVVRDAELVELDQTLAVRLATGALICVVKGKHPHGQENV
jgi:exodeoxyribonuclease VII large subunit